MGGGAANEYRRLGKLKLSAAIPFRNKRGGTGEVLCTTSKLRFELKLRFVNYGLFPAIRGDRSRNTEQNVMLAVCDS